VPPTPWFGNEVEKRSFALALATTVSCERDWLFLFDADEVVSTVPYDLAARLDRTDLDVAETTLWERWDGDDESERLVPGASLSTSHPRKFYRALAGLEVVGSHYCYGVPDRAGGTRWLWGNPHMQDLEPAVELHDFESEHRHRYRNPYRLRQAYEYYALRDQADIEAVPQ
jgi:hypothetical protein